MQQLNLPAYEMRLMDGKSGKPRIFDPIRRRFVSLTPEEWVRQHFLNFLVNYKHYPPSLIAVEVSLTYHKLQKRGDIVVYGNHGRPCLIVECKAPEVQITQDVFDQIAMYNMSLLVDWLVVTNGIDHFACRIDHPARSYSFLQDIPSYDQIVG